MPEQSLPPRPEDDWGAPTPGYPISHDTSEGWREPVVPAVQPEGPVGPTPKRGRIGRRVGGALLALGTLTGVGGSGYDALSLDHTVSAQETLAAHDAFEHAAPLKPQIANELGRAVSFDTCNTRVTTKSVQSIYNRVFGEVRLPKTLSGLREQTKATTKRLETASDKLTFVPLNKEQQQFISDSYEGGFRQSYQEFRTVFSGYLAQRHIQFVDAWDDNSQFSSGKNGASLSADVKQMSSKELDESAVAKVQMVLAMQALSSLPMEVQNVAGPLGLHEIVVGDISDPNFVAEAPWNSSLVVLDADPGKNMDLNSALGRYMVATLDHEATHLFDNAVCATALGDYVGDPGYESLNRTFNYSKQAVTILSGDKTVDGRYTTAFGDSANHKPKEAVVTSGYGATNELEDKATLLGENVLYPGGNSGLFNTVANTDETIIYEKTALLLARLQVKNPAVAEYYIARLQAARVLDAVYAATGPISKAESDALNAAYHRDPNTYENDLKYMMLETAIAPYQKLEAMLQGKINDPTHMGNYVSVGGKGGK